MAQVYNVKVEYIESYSYRIRAETEEEAREIGEAMSQEDTGNDYYLHDSEATISRIQDQRADNED